MFMAFLDKLGKKIGEVADTATDKAKDFAETTKLNQAVSAAEKQITQHFIEIGKFVFENDKENPDSPVAEICGKISTALKEIDELKQKILEIKTDNK